MHKLLGNICLLEKHMATMTTKARALKQVNPGCREADSYIKYNKAMVKSGKLRKAQRYSKYNISEF